jgi:hypothetical protein
MIIVLLCEVKDGVTLNEPEAGFPRSTTHVLLEDSPSESYREAAVCGIGFFPKNSHDNQDQSAWPEKALTRDRFSSNIMCVISRGLVKESKFKALFILNSSS